MDHLPQRPTSTAALISSQAPGQDYDYDHNRQVDDGEHFPTGQSRIEQTSPPRIDCQNDAVQISGSNFSTKANLLKSFLALCRRNVWILPALHTHFWFSAGTALLQPYFPPLAASKGISAWEYGFAFSAFKIAMLLGSIATERLIVFVSPSVVYVSGQVGFFLFVVMFGALYWSPKGDVFLGLSIPGAFFGGFVSCVYVVSMYSMLTEKFSGNTGIIIAVMELLWGVGNMAGSILGGALIDLWKYPLPFFVIPTIMMLSAPIIAIRGMVPKEHRREVTEDSTTEDVKYYKALCDPVFLIDMVTVMLSWVIMSFNEPTLEPYLAQFHLSSTQVGTIFMVQFAGYCIGALPTGILCSYFDVDELFIFVAQFLTAFAYLILGPAPFLPGPPTLWMIYLSQFFTGIGMAAQFVCSFSHALKRLKMKGYPDSIRTSGFVSSCVYTSLVFGAVTTPPLAGYLVEKLGYRLGTMPLFGILVLWTCVTFLVWMTSLFCNYRPEPRNPTLNPTLSSVNSSTVISYSSPGNEIS
ncbi:MFS-type transporter SLC18B1-like [Ornithodoros turicata]|uniref:MFS-type transporter SLC18B1-like n=1 Tax=Ornithodoros turicata TaxID=34597 RepID=UPI0031394963